MTHLSYIFISGLFSYFIGSIPFGLILAKLFGYGDIRKIGSGNIGATNVLRTGSKKLGLATLILDSMKGLLAIVLLLSLAKYLSVLYPSCSGIYATVCPEGYNYTGQMTCMPSRCSNIPFYFLSKPIFFDTLTYSNMPLPVLFYPAVIAFFAVLGHCFPVWLKFRGGKGVATSIGALIFALPYTGLAAALTWCISLFLFRISSLAAILALGIVPIVTYFVYGQYVVFVCLLITLLVWFRHKDNIKRLMAGTEPKIGAK